MRDVEELLKKQHCVQVYTEGYSMYPLLVPGRDAVIIEPAQAEEVRRCDVVLYRRDESILVLHRVWKKTGTALYMVGDNQTEIEGPLRYDQVRGKMVGIVRKGRRISLHHPVYLLYSHLWLALRPIRPVLAKPVRLFRRLLKRD